MNYLEMARNAKAAMDALLKKATDEKRIFTDEEQKDFDKQKTDFNKYIEMDKNAKEAAKINDSIKPVDDTPNIQIKNEKKWGNDPVEAAANYLQAVARASVPGGHVDHKLIKNAALGGNTDVPEEGGFLVEDDLRDGIKEKIYKQSVVAKRCNLDKIAKKSNSMTFNRIKGDSRATGSRYGGARAYWIEQAGALTASQPLLEQVTVKLNKIAGLAYLTSEQIEDGAAMVSLINREIPKEIAYMVDSAIIDGTGTGQPLGIFRSGGKVDIAAQTPQDAATIVVENINKMYARIDINSLNNKGLAWFYSRDILPELYTMGLIVGAGGGPVYLPPSGASGKPYSSLMGIEMIPIEQAPVLGTVGDLGLYDFSQYQLIDKGKVKKDSSIHVQFLTDQTAYRFIYRVGGQPYRDAPETPANGGDTTSPFVRLATRS